MDGNLTWLDVIPALPLASSVPIIRCADQPDPGVRCIVLEPSPSDYADGRVFWFCSGSQYLARFDAVRIDLSDPQGYSYALRLLCMEIEKQGLSHAAVCGMPPTGTYPWLFGRITDFDRLTLAKLLLKVFSG